MRKRVVQWATGPVGRHAVATMVEHPDIDVVGAFVYAADKVGRDLGEICGIGPIGVTATGNRDEIVGLDADCVVVERLEGACVEGGSTFHATGIEPGWASEVLPLAMSGIFRCIESLVVQELLDYASYDNTFMLFDVMGFGRTPDAPDVLGADPAVLGSVFRAPLLLVAEGLGATVDHFTFDRQVAVAVEAFDVAAGRIEPGTVEALRFSATAVIDGRPALTVEHITRLRPDAAPDWPTGRGWKVSVEGRPSMVLEAKIAVHGEDENDQGCLATAMHAVHAVVPVCDAAPGIKTFLDLPTIVGRHVLRVRA